MPATAAKVVGGRVSVCSIRVSLAFLTAPRAASPRAKIDSPKSLTEDDKSSAGYGPAAPTAGFSPGNIRSAICGTKQPLMGGCKHCSHYI